MSTYISYLIYVEISFLNVDNKFSIIVCFRTRVYSSKIGRQVYTRDRETRPGSVISYSRKGTIATLPGEHVS